MKLLKNKIPILIEIADSNFKRQNGLMFRKSIPDNYGMLFSFDMPQVLKFWGMNTLIPLDICFMDENFIVKSISSIKPHDLNSVASICPCKFALETNLGFLDRYGIKNGTKLKLWKEGPSSFMDLDFEKVAQVEEKKDKSKQEVGESKQEEISQLVEEKNSKPDVNINNISEEDFEDDSESKLLVDNEKTTKPDVQKQNTENIIEKTDSGKLKKYPKFSSFFEALRWSYSNGEVIRIFYKTLNGHMITRDIEPHGLFKSKKSGRQVLVTFDRNVNQPRSYIAMNVNQYSFIGRKYQKKFIFI